MKEAPDECVQVFVSGFRSGSIAVDLRACDDVEELKKGIEASEGVPALEQRLVFGWKELRHGNSLASSGIRKESAIHLYLRGRGGGGLCSRLQASTQADVVAARASTTSQAVVHIAREEEKEATMRSQQQEEISVEEALASMQAG